MWPDILRYVIIPAICSLGWIWTFLRDYKGPHRMAYNMLGMVVFTVGLQFVLRVTS